MDRKRSGRRIERDLMDVQFFSVWGFEMKLKTVGKCNGVGLIYLPKEWVGKNVAIVLKDSIDARR
jgi:hypothetical protein